MLLSSLNEVTVRLGAALVVALYAIGVAPLADAAVSSTRARVAHVLNANERANLHLVRASGSTLNEEGHASGSLPGRIRAQLHVGAALTGTIVLDARNGEIKARGKAQPQSGHYPWENFVGTATITGGTGRYAHAHGSGSFSGAFNRRTYAAVLQTRGKLYY